MTPLINTSLRSLVLALFAGVTLFAQAPAPAKPAATESEDAPVRKKRPVTPRKKKVAEPEVKVVDINHASKDELKALQGITDDLAQRIIQNRPYQSKAFLVTKNVIPLETYQAIRKQIAVK